MQDWGSLTSARLECSFLPFGPHLVCVAAWKVIHVSTENLCSKSLDLSLLFQMLDFLFSVPHIVMTSVQRRGQV
jgi:hypothetical protein